jgi:hypothetical protein
MTKPREKLNSQEHHENHFSTAADASRLYRPKTFSALTRQRFMRDRRKRWHEHVGGHPTSPQLVLIDQVAALEWDIRRLEAKEDVKGGRLTQHDKNALAAWRRHFREALRQLGPPAKAKPASLAEVMAAARQHEEAAA